MNTNKYHSAHQINLKEVIIPCLSEFVTEDELAEFTRSVDYDIHHMEEARKIAEKINALAVEITNLTKIRDMMIIGKKSLTKRINEKRKIFNNSVDDHSRSLEFAISYYEYTISLLEKFLHKYDGLGDLIVEKKKEHANKYSYDTNSSKSEPFAGKLVSDSI